MNTSENGEGRINKFVLQNVGSMAQLKNPEELT
jgi:hypothetical protein